MLHHFNNISIRGKLTVIVAVAALTTAVLISVWLTSRQEVRKDVLNELEAARHDFVVGLFTGVTVGTIWPKLAVQST